MIITLCGSARFEPWYLAWNEALTCAGHAVFTLTAFPSQRGGTKEWYTPEIKAALDRAHLLKIEASAAVLVLNPFAYLGESTLREVAHAAALGREIYALGSWGRGYGVGRGHYESYQAAARRYGVPEGYGSPIPTMDFRRAHDLLGDAGPARSALVKMLRAVDIAEGGARDDA